MSYATHTSSSADSISKTSLSLIGDIKAVERSFNAIAAQAADLGIKRNDNEGDIAFLGRIALAAKELSYDLRKQEDAADIQKQIEGKSLGRRRGIAGFFDKLGDAAARL